VTALVKWVTELRTADLQACHCVEKFTLRRIHPLGYQEKLAYDYLRLVDLSREPAADKMFNLHFYY
jgi:hypothetical protein